MFKKYTQGVYCLELDQKDLSHGDNVTVKTRRGKEVDCVIWKKLFEKNGKIYYSYVRADGFNRTEWTRRKMERAENAAGRQERLSGEYYQKAQKGRDFLALGEPIKVGHHSEKKHRKLIEDNWNNMGKSVKAADKAQDYERKASELESRLNKEINIDTPESLEQLKERITGLEARRDSMKANGGYEKWELTNLGAKIRRYKKRLETAKKLWDVDYKPEPKKKVESKQDKVNKLLEDCGVIWAFSNAQFDKNKKDGQKYVSIGAGGFVPVENHKKFLTELNTI